MKSVLRAAIFENRISDVARITKGQPALIDQRDADGYTPLSDALFYNNIQALELLHEAGVDYTIGWDGKPPLYWALLYSNANIQCFLFSAPKLKMDEDSKRILSGLRQGKTRTEIIVEELGAIDVNGGAG